MSKQTIFRKSVIVATASGLLTSQALFANFTVIENFESFPLGLLSTGQQAGSFNIVEGISPGSTRAAEINTPSRRVFDWSGPGQTVATFSFDFFNPTFAGSFTEGRVIFVLNQNDQNIASGANNLIRFAIGTQPEDATVGRFAFEQSTGASYVDDTYPLDTLITVHFVVNNTSEEATNPDGPVIVGANTVQLWMEIGGVQSLVGVSGITADRLDASFTHLGLGTFGAYNRGGVVIDNIRYTSGIAVIPEPSTYAALFGLLGLGLAIVRRRLLRKS